MKFKMKKRVVLLVAIVLVATVAVYFAFFFTRGCGDKACFNSALAECSKVSYLSDVEDGTWIYKIKGKSGGECKVDVELLSLKEGTTDMLKLEGKSMVCSLPLGMVIEPQDSLTRCHGILREEMQDVIITRLHNYVVDNLGEINEELDKI